MQIIFFTTRRLRAGALGSVLALLTACSQTPSQLSQFPNDLDRKEVDAHGIYPDGWTEETASANLEQPSGNEVLTVRGTVPKVYSADFHSEVILLVDGNEVGRRAVGLGNFQLSAPVKRGAGTRKVTVKFSAAQQLPGGDGRTVGARMEFLGFEPAKAAPAEAMTDIARGNLKLGTGWGPLETFKSEHFRWVENDAVVQITPERSGDAELALTVEAGPGVDGKCLLKVLDVNGRQVAAVKIAGRQTVSLFVPVEAGKANEFRLHVDEGGKKIASDPRVLNFRVFELAAKLH